MECFIFRNILGCPKVVCFSIFALVLIDLLNIWDYLDISRYKRPTTARICVRMIFWTVPKTCFTKLVSVAVVSKAYFARFSLRSWPRNLSFTKLLQTGDILSREQDSQVKR